MTYKVDDIVVIKERYGTPAWPSSGRYKIVEVDDIAPVLYRIEREDGSRRWIEENYVDPAPAEGVTEEVNTPDPNRDPVDGDIMYVLIDGPYVEQQTTNRGLHRRGDRVRVLPNRYNRQGTVYTEALNSERGGRFGAVQWSINRDQLSFDPPADLPELSLPETGPISEPVLTWAPGARVKRKDSHNQEEGTLIERWNPESFGDDRPAWNMRWDNSTYDDQRYQSGLELIFPPDPRVGQKDSADDAWFPGATVRFKATGQFENHGGVENFRVGCKRAPFDLVREHIIELKKRPYGTDYDVTLEFGPLVQNPSYPDVDDEGYFAKGSYSISMAEAEEVGHDFEVTKVIPVAVADPKVEVKFEVTRAALRNLRSVLSGYDHSQREALAAIDAALDGKSNDPF